jgi:hypothetical protein
MTVGGGERDTLRAARAAWLDVLPITWIKSFPFTKHEEFKRTLKSLVSGGELKKFSPFGDSLLAIFDQWKPENFMTALKKNSVTEFVIEAFPHRNELSQKLQKGSLSMAELMNVDRTSALKNHDSQKVFTHLEAKRNEHYLREAIKAHRALLSEGDKEYTKLKNGLHILPTEEDVIGAFNNPEKFLPLMPFTSIEMQYIENWSQMVSKMTKGSKRFQGRRSDFIDVFHLVGAAYADIFTCDSTTKQRGGSRFFKFRTSKIFFSSII